MQCWLEGKKGNKTRIGRVRHALVFFVNYQGHARVGKRNFSWSPTLPPKPAVVHHLWFGLMFPLVNLLKSAIKHSFTNCYPSAHWTYTSYSFPNILYSELNHAWKLPYIDFSECLIQTTKGQFQLLPARIALCPICWMHTPFKLLLASDMEDSFDSASSKPITGSKRQLC